VLCNDDVQPVLNRWIREGRATDPSYVLPEDHAGFIERFGMRDQAMAANLLGELERAPGTRFAGWLANGHAQRDVASINGGEPRFTSLITMGRLLHEALGDELYVLSTTSYSGQMHDGGTRGPTPLEPAAPGSLERALHDTRVRTGFVDVRTLPADSPWRRPQSWRVWGPEQASAALPDLVDGILYIDRQHGAHPARA
jgi:erythromycin esterase-like protein